MGVKCSEVVRPLAGSRRCFQPGLICLAHHAPLRSGGGQALAQSPSARPYRYALLRKSKERQGLDGLNNLNYFANITYDALYKNITVNLTPELAQVNEY